MSGRSIFGRVRLILRVLAVIFSFLPSILHRWIWELTDLLPNVVGVGLRYALAKAKTRAIGDNVYWGRNVTAKNWSNLSIGDNCSIHENCFLDALGEIEIGSNVSIAHACSLVSFDHVAQPNIPIKIAQYCPEPYLLLTMFGSQRACVSCEIHR